MLVLRRRRRRRSTLFPYTTLFRSSGKRIRLRHDLNKPQGVRGRNSDNTRLREALRWEPATPLEDGLVATYKWICQQLERSDRKSTRLNSSHQIISYAVFCLKKKKN